MKTNNLSFALSLGVWIAAGTYGCSGTSSDPNSVSGSVGGSSSNSNAGGQTGKGGSQSNSAGGSSATSSNAAGGKTGGGNVGGASSDTQTGSDAEGGANNQTAASVNKNVGGAVTSSSGKATGGAANTVGPKPVGGTSNVTTKPTGGGAGPGGGRGQVGGAAPTAGGAPAAGGSAANSSNAPPTGSCTIAQKTGEVGKIASVGVVTFSVTGASSLDSAEIKFGLDTTYGLSAPVDVKTAAADYRTLLLGMKAGKTYHYKIVGKSGSNTCESTDYTIEAGGCPTSISRPKVDPATSTIKDKLDGGFVVMEGYKATSDGNDYSYILDGDGDLVWCYRPSSPTFGDLTASRMSWDGKYMWMVHGNVPSGTAKMGRVTMDGAEFKDFSSQFTGLNHDAVILPNDEAIGYIAYGTGGSQCDDIKEFSPSSNSSKTIFNLSKAFPSGSCHGNAIKYDDTDKTYIVSDDSHSGYVKIDRSGTVKWVLGGGSANHFDKSGSGASTWTGQHNLHILGDDGAGYYRILFFNNGTSSAMSSGVNAVIREIGLDLKAMTTKEFWQYAAGISNPVMGDVQRLENGNTIIAYSLAGIIHEVDKSGKLLQKLTWSGGSSGIGYITKRKTLYGPSPR